MNFLIRVDLLLFYFQTEKLLMINLHAVDFKDKKFENLPVKTVILTCDSNDKYEAVSYLSGNENGFTPGLNFFKGQYFDVFLL